MRSSRSLPCRPVAVPPTVMRIFRNITDGVGRLMVIIHGAEDMTDSISSFPEVAADETALQRVNEALWVIEDDIREIKLLQEHLHDGLGQLVYDRMRRRPMILPVVVEV